MVRHFLLAFNSAVEAEIFCFAHNHFLSSADDDLDSEGDKKNAALHDEGDDEDSVHNFDAEEQDEDDNEDSVHIFDDIPNTQDPFAEYFSD